MARRGWSTANHLNFAGGVVIAYPLTIAAWAKTSVTTSEQYIAGLYQSSSNNNRCAIRTDGSAHIQADTVSSAGGEDAPATSTTYSANTWFHACGVFAAANDRRAFLNGGGKATGTTSETLGVGAINQTRIGTRGGSSAGSPFAPAGTGDIAEVSIWNVALSDADVLSLSKGIHPFLVRPDALVGYWPLIGSYSPEINLKSNTAVMTMAGTVTQSAHTRVFMPAHRPIRRVTTAVAAGLKYPQLERGIRGVERGVAIGGY